MKYIAFTAIALVLAACAYIAGLLMGEFGAMTNRFHFEKKLIDDYVRSDRNFGGLTAEMYTADGTAYLSGSVGSRGELERLRRLVIEVFGKTSRIDRLCGVSVTGDEEGP